MVSQWQWKYLKWKKDTIPYIRIYTAGTHNCSCCARAADLIPNSKAHHCRSVVYHFTLSWSPHTPILLCMITWAVHMLCTAQLGGPVLKAFRRVQNTPLQLADKSPMITDQHTAGGSVSQLSQLAKLSSWLTFSTKDITTSFWHYNKWFCFSSNQIMGLYNFSNPIK